jgi:ribosomal protein L11 methyltransferase
MNWIELTVHTTSAGADSVSALLMDAGASGTQTEDRADIPDPSRPHGIWEIIDPRLLDSMPEDVLVHGWYDPEDSSPGLKARLESALLRLSESGSDLGTLKLEFRETPNEDWGESWKLLYHPIRAGKHLVIKPSWESFDALPGDHIIEMDPGMAFGSGYHDTTVLCLELLEKYITPGSHVIDVGTGSGILALGAALSGAGDVLAIDIDPDAVRVASENVEHHGLSDLIRVREGNLLNQVSEVCDICVANIIADIILTLASPLKDHIRPGGLFICSGIIVERADEIRKVLTEAGYEILEEKCTEEWAAFCARRSL